MDSNVIEGIIEQRLRLQTNRRILDNEFGISATMISVKGFARHSYKSLPEPDRKKFIITVGGRANFASTENFINSLGGVKV